MAKHRARTRRAAKRLTICETGLSDQAYVNVFVEARHTDQTATSPTATVIRAIEVLVTAASLPPEVARPVVPRRNFISATVRVADLLMIAAMADVTFVHAAESLTFSLPIAAAATASLQPTPRSVKVNGKMTSGDSVLIGFVDVGGFDFPHEDFLDNAGDTRFVAIWDKGRRFRGAGIVRAWFGVHGTAAQGSRRRGASPGASPKRQACPGHRRRTRERSDAGISRAGARSEPSSARSRPDGEPRSSPPGSCGLPDSSREARRLPAYPAASTVEHGFGQSIRQWMSNIGQYVNSRAEDTPHFRAPTEGSWSKTPLSTA